MKTAAVFFADGFEEIEGLSPVDYLRRGGVNVITVGVKGKNFEQGMIVTSSHNVPIITDTTLADYLKEYGENCPDCVVCPGGSKGADNLAENKDLLAHLEKCFSEGKLTAAICASPAVVFGKTKITDGKKWTCYPGMENEANPDFLRGYENSVFVTDGNVVTGRGPGASEQFAMELVRILCGEAVANKVHDGAQQR